MNDKPGPNYRMERIHTKIESGQMKFVEKANIWLPDNDPTVWVTRDGMAGAYPAYQYDRIEASVMRCKQKRTCIDGGSHVGLWSLHLADLFRGVLAFEPVPDNADCFRVNTGHLKNVTLYTTALGKTSGGEVSMSMKGSQKSVSWSVSKTEESTRARLTALDDLCLRTVDLIKLDVEGYELEALMGARDTIERCRPVIIIEEKHDPEFRASAFLTELGMYMVQQLKHDRIFTWEPEAT
jgi:FkbM family methyltransferase